MKQPQRASRPQGYIVHACNHYPQLVAALRDLIAASDQFVQDTGLKNSDAITDAAESARSLLRSLGES